MHRLADLGWHFCDLVDDATRYQSARSRGARLVSHQLAADLGSADVVRDASEGYS